MLYYNTQVILKNICFFQKKRWLDIWNCKWSPFFPTGNERTSFLCCRDITGLFWCCRINWIDGCSKMSIWDQILLLTFNRNIWWQLNSCLLLRSWWHVFWIWRYMEKFTTTRWWTINAFLVSFSKCLQGFKCTTKIFMMLDLLANPFR